MDNKRNEEIIKELINKEQNESFEIFSEHMEFGSYWPNLPKYTSSKEYINDYRLYQKLKNDKKATLSLEKAIELEPNNLEYLKEYIAKEESFFVHCFAMPQLSFLYGGQKQPIDKIIELEKNNPENFIVRAIFYKKCEKYKQGIENIITAINLGLKDSKTYELLGDYFIYDKQYDEAIKTYTHALKLSIWKSELYSKRAEAYIRNKNEIEAFLDANRSLYYNNKNADAHFIKYQIYYKFNETIHAEFALKSAIENTKENYLLESRYSLLAKLYHENKQYKNEIEVLDKQIRLTYDSKFFCTKCLKQKIKAQFLSFRLLGIIPCLILLIKKKYEEFQLMRFDFFD